MSNIQVSVRISPHLHEKLLAHTSSVGLSKSKVISQALTQYLEGDEIQPLSLEERITKIEQRLALLESTPSKTKPAIVETISNETLSSIPLPLPQQLTIETPKVNETGEIVEWVVDQVQCFKEVLGDGVALEMIYIPGGTFLMGSPETEKGSQQCEIPQHSVTLGGFFLGKFPITQRQWETVANYPKVQRELAVEPAFFKGSDRPVESISWEDAVEFCDRLSRYTQHPYQLPSETQWEYACRARTLDPFSFGATLTGDLANYMAKHLYKSEGFGIYRKETTPVDFFYPNGFGLYDLHGNVWEWCADAWHPNYENAPIAGEPWLSSETNACHVLRGGSWDYDAHKCRCSSRYAYHPKAVGVNQFGFRVMCALPYIEH
ncbi:MAG: formylglycine-generating enzyme family protein [Cyanobacteria bacterium P01_G01_bin.49]